MLRVVGYIFWLSMIHYHLNKETQPTHDKTSYLETFKVPDHFQKVESDCWQAYKMREAEEAKSSKRLQI